MNGCDTGVTNGARALRRSSREPTTRPCARPRHSRGRSWRGLSGGAVGVGLRGVVHRRGRSRRSGCRRRPPPTSPEPVREVAPGGAEVARGGVRRVVDVLRVGHPVAVAVRGPVLPRGRDELQRTPRPLPQARRRPARRPRRRTRRARARDRRLGRPSREADGRRSCRAATRPSRCRRAWSSPGGTPGSAASCAGSRPRRRAPPAPGHRRAAPCDPPTAGSPRPPRASVPPAGRRAPADGCCRTVPRRARATGWTRSTGPGLTRRTPRPPSRRGRRQRRRLRRRRGHGRVSGDRLACREIRNGGTSTVRTSIVATSQPTAFCWPGARAASVTGVPGAAVGPLPPAVVTVSPAGAPGERVDAASWVGARAGSSRRSCCRRGSRTPDRSPPAGSVPVEEVVPPVVLVVVPPFVVETVQDEPASCTCWASGPSGGC